MAVRINRSSARKGKSAQTILFLAAMGAAVAFFSFSQRTDEQVAQAAPAPVVGQFDMVRIPVPAEPVPAGTTLRQVRFENISFPAHQLPAGYIRSIEPYANAVATAALPARLPLFRENLSLTAHSSNPVIDQIPDGMRAMTIQVDATAAVEGWAGSGSYVDVMLVESKQTTVIAERVKILSAERSVTPVDGSSTPHVPSTVTLLVTQEQCLAINTAIPHGKIAFALRSHEDENVWRDKVFTAERLKKGRVVRTENGVITGFASLKDRDNQERAFALANNQWSKTSHVPPGFLPAREKRKTEAESE